MTRFLLHSLMICAAILIGSAVSTAASQDEKPVVELTVGSVAGFVDDDGVATFRGIPYAAPPVGSLRWKPPAPAASWQAARDASEYGPRCYQRSTNARNMDHVLSIQGVSWFRRKIIAAMMAFSGGPETSEDCLYLNVQSRNVGGDELLPVLVWTHGGGHQSGSGSQRPYGSNALVERGVVQVTINYRLGVFGFLAHPELSAESPHRSSGNYGMLDQIAALEWVREHIASFGGDPNNVTIFGESAGGHNVGMLTASPLSRGLFHKAIAMSGTGAHQVLHLRREVGGLASAETSGAEFVGQLGLESDANPIATLREWDAATIQKASQGVIGGNLSFHPKVDGWFLPKATAEIYADGEAAGIPMMVGSTADEGLLFQGPLALGRSLFPEAALTADTPESYVATMRAAFGADADRMLELYPSDDPELAGMRLFTDGYFGASARFVAAEQTRHGHPAWLYLFTRTPPGEFAKAGAFHGADVGFTFGMSRALGPPQDYDEELAETIGDYIAQFARTGDPNEANRPAWPAYDPKNPRWQEWGARIGPAPVSRTESYDAFDRRQRRILERADGRVAATTNVRDTPDR